MSPGIFIGSRLTQLLAFRAHMGQNHVFNDQDGRLIGLVVALADRRSVPLAELDGVSPSSRAEPARQRSVRGPA
jgi:hypothetical protein